MKKNLTLQIAHRIERIQPSPTLAITQRADELRAAGKNILNLSVGESDFDTPDHIKEAAIKAIRDGHTKYTAVDGIAPLKQALVDKFARENHLNYALNQVLVSCGAKHSLYNLCSAVLNPGDEVIIPAPYWVSYPDIVKLTDGNPVIIKADLAQQFKITPAQLKNAITDKTRIFIINSPSNPSGMAYSAQELAALAEVLLPHPNIIIASDDMYEHDLWNHTPFQNILNVCPELYDRCVIINGVSKSYAMTGWRIGYAAGPAKVIAGMKKAQSQSTSNPVSISQYAALAALTGDQQCVAVMTKAYKERHGFVVASLQKISGIQCISSDGTFFTFPSIEAFINPNTGLKDDLAFAEFLLNKAEIAIVPGSAFGMPGYMRLSFAVNMAGLQEAMERIKKALSTLKRPL